MVNLRETFRYFRPFKALVLGDFMLDTYTTGRVKRISPEAPVPVIEVLKQESRAGGAGNVVLNLNALGAMVFAVGRIGDDEAGSALKEHLFSSDTTLLLEERGYQTPVKNRLIADSQQLIRIDFEKVVPLGEELEKKILKEITELMSQVHVIALSDYGKGFLSTHLIQSVLKMAKEANIPTIVDPKGIDFSKYCGASMIKPNLSEAYAAAKCESHASLEEVAAALKPLTETLLITRSEAGISVFDSQGVRSDFPVRSKEVKDVTGAGDTVLAMISLGLANGLDVDVSAQLANIAAGLCIERLGCVQITLSELAQRLLEIDSDSKIFDESHTYALQQMLFGKKYKLLVLSKGQSLSKALLQAIRDLSSNKEEELIIYVRDTDPSDELIHLLSNLHEVGYIILQTESLKNLMQAIHPHEVYLLKKNELTLLDQGKDLLNSLLIVNTAHANP